MTAAGLDDLARAGTLDHRLELLHELTERDPNAVAAVVDRAEDLVHDRPTDSWALAELGAHASDDPGLRARATYVQARIAAERGQLDRALELIEAAREGWRAAGEPLRALRTDLGRMHVLDDLGRHHDAIEVGTRLSRELAALTASKEHADDQESAWLRATAHNNLGVAYSFLGDHVQATAEYQEAVAAYETGGLAEEAAKTQANQGIELLVLGRAREALEVLQRAEQAFAAADDRLWAAKCAGHVAAAHRQLGELVTALRLLRDARATLLGLGAEVEAARLRSTIAEVYLAAGLFDEARSEAAEAAELLGALQLPHDQAVATFTGAVAAVESGDLRAADTALDLAGELFASVGDQHSSARVRRMRAVSAARSGRHALARAEAEAEADALSAGGWSLDLCWALLQRADAAETGAERDEHLSRAAALVDSLQLPALQFALALRQARRQRELGDPDRAHLSLLDAVALAERVGATLTSSELRPAFRADHAAVYDELVDLLTGPEEIRAVSDRATAALLASHRAKSVTLVHTLEGSIGRRTGRPGSAEAEIDRARADLSALYHAMSRSTDVELAGRLGRQATELEHRLTLLQLDADLGRSDLDVHGHLGPVRAASPTGRPALVLAYHLLEQDLVIFVDDGDQVHHRRVPGARAGLEQALDRLHGHWGQFRMDADFLARHAGLMLRTAVDLLTTLHDLLIGPVADVLPADHDPDADLVVVPHRRLHQVPFAALHDGQQYLLQRWTVTVAPTAAGPDALPVRAAGEELLVVGVPDEAATSISAELAELRSVRPDAQVLLGSAATTAALRSALPGPAYVHVACHGLFRVSNPMFSALRLHDRWLTAAELLEYDFGGALVTLGACETGRTEPGGAEATGLSWSLLTSGASGVIVSHWLVDDVATARFTPELYRNLTAGHLPAQALRRAQLAAASLGVHPFYWAAFSYVAVHGDTRIGAPT